MTTVSLVDNDTVPSVVTIDLASAEEGEDLVFTICIKPPLSGWAQVRHGFLDETATARLDYTRPHPAGTYLQIGYDRAEVELRIPTVGLGGAVIRLGPPPKCSEERRRGFAPAKNNLELATAALLQIAQAESSALNLGTCAAWSVGEGAVRRVSGHEVEHSCGFFEVVVTGHILDQPLSQWLNVPHPLLSQPITKSTLVST